MKKYKWIPDTEIAQKIYKDKIVDSRLDQKTGTFELKVEDGEYGVTADGVPFDSNYVFTAPSSGVYSTSGTYTFGNGAGTVVWMDSDTGETYDYVDPDTCATKEPGTGEIQFAEKEIEGDE
jgi:hypothetical protein